ncbi:MAG: hypothetical protein WC881_02785 [Elusimicrobiota bacterium]
MIRDNLRRWGRGDRSLAGLAACAWGVILFYIVGHSRFFGAWLKLF